MRGCSVGKCRPTARIHTTGQAEHEEGLRKAAKAASKAKAKPKSKAKAKGKAKASKQAPGDDFPSSMLPNDPIEPAEGDDNQASSDPIEPAESAGKKASNDPIEPAESAGKKTSHMSAQEKAKIDDSLRQLAAAGLVDCGPPAMLSSGTPPGEFFKKFSGKCLIRIL